MFEFFQSMGHSNLAGEVAWIDAIKGLVGAFVFGQMMAWAEYALYTLLGILFLVFALRTIRRAKSSLREILEVSLDDEQTKKVEIPKTLEESVVDAAVADTELAGRTLRRWLYENVGDR